MFLAKCTTFAEGRKALPRCGGGIGGVKLKLEKKGEGGGRANVFGKRRKTKREGSRMEWTYGVPKGDTPEKSGAKARNGISTLFQAPDWRLVGICGATMDAGTSAKQGVSPSNHRWKR